MTTTAFKNWFKGPEELLGSLLGQLDGPDWNAGMKRETRRLCRYPEGDARHGDGQLGDVVIEARVAARRSEDPPKGGTGGRLTCTNSLYELP
jgi:hypothetical protein